MAGDQRSIKQCTCRTRFTGHRFNTGDTGPAATVYKPLVWSTWNLDVKPVDAQRPLSALRQK
jgi:hypothetical protein